MTEKMPGESDLAGWAKLAETEDGAIRAISDPLCPREVIEIALANFPHSAPFLGSNPSAPGDLLEKAYVMVNHWVHKRQILENPNVPETLIELAVLDYDEQIRKYVAETTSDTQKLWTLARDDSNTVRVSVAKNSWSSIETLEALLSPFSENVAAAVLENSNCTVELWSSIAEFVMRPETRPENAGDFIFGALLRGASREQLNAFFEATPTEHRFWALENPEASDEILLRVLDGDIQVRYVSTIDSFLKHENLSAAVLLAALRNFDPVRFGKVAKYQPLPNEVAAQLLKIGDDETKIAVIGNPSVSGEVLLPLVGDSSIEVTEALGRRTYQFWEPGIFPSVSREFVGRGEVWSALEGFGGSNLYKINLTLEGEPGWVYFDAEYANTELINPYEDSAPGVLEGPLQEFKLSILGGLSDAVLMDGSSSVPGIVLLEAVNRSYEIYVEEEDLDGEWSVLYSYSSEVQFVAKSTNLEILQTECVEGVLKYLRMVDLRSADTSEIVKITATVMAQGAKVVDGQVWYEAPTDATIGE